MIIVYVYNYTSFTFVLIFILIDSIRQPTLNPELFLLCRRERLQRGGPLLTVENEVNGPMGTQRVQMKRVLPRLGC